MYFSEILRYLTISRGDDRSGDVTIPAAESRLGGGGRDRAASVNSRRQPAAACCRRRRGYVRGNTLAVGRTVPVTGRAVLKYAPRK